MQSPEQEILIRRKGSSAQLQQRRLDALAMLSRGKKPIEVARTFHGSLVSVGRSEIELLFKWMKPHLQIKPFFGTMLNAVKSYQR